MTTHVKSYYIQYNSTSVRLLTSTLVYIPSVSSVCHYKLKQNTA